MPHFEAVIHPTAIIHPGAKLDSTVQVEPYAIIDSDVEIGPDCIIGPHVCITGATKIGAANRFHAGSVIGDAPQDLRYAGERTGLRIGDHNVFREHFTVHRSNKSGEDTVIGSHNYFMANSHVAHNCVIGDHVIVANGALLAGHATVQDRAFISGNCLVHQFTRVGTLAMMQGGSAISKDLPPFTVALRQNEMCGLNTVGLRRAGFTAEERLELRHLYHLLFRQGGRLQAAVQESLRNHNSPPAKTLLGFVADARRGVCSDVRGKNAAIENPAD